MSEADGVKRRLTCILAADAVGYSRNMSLDEERTLRVLAAHRAVIDGIIAFHDGRIVNTAGDSVLAEFASPVEAVRCAVEVQDALKTRNDALPEADRLHFRVGVNLGDVVVKNEDLLGDGVNVAARLEGIAEPGGICISSSVYDQITGKLNLGFQDIGEQNLKNISRPIRAYRIAGTGAPARPAPAAAPSRPARGPLLGAGAVVAAALLGFGAWKFGWLGGAAAPPAPAPAPTAAAAPAADPAAIKSAVDDAVRARMEAELARVRGDAEAAKRAADAELARAHADADASRAARLKSEAEATTTRAQADAAAIRRAADADRAQAEQARRDAEAARTAAVTARDASAVAAPVPPAPPPAPARGAAPGPYDGRWLVTRSCDKFQELAEFSEQFVTTIVNGEVNLERGRRDQPGSMQLHGSVAADGRLALTGTVISRSKRNLGRPTPAGLEGTLAGPTPTLTGGWGGRHCTLAFERPT